MFYEYPRTNPRNEYKKRIEDREFLGRLRNADIDELTHIYNNHRGSSTPVWKRIAIERAIRRKYTK